MTKVISTINLKGGVGKTSLTVALAEFLADESDYKVLVIDVDPQTNATVSLISQEDWKNLDQNGKTLASLFKDKIRGMHEFNLNDSIVKNVSNVHGGIKNLDLLPSSLKLIDLQDLLSQIPSITRYSLSPVEVLQKEMNEIIESNKYDYIFIDCPPNLGLITQNALRMSNYYLIPVVPDIISTLGIPQIISNVESLSKLWNSKIECLGIVLTKVKAVQLHRSQITFLKNKSRDKEYPKILDSEIKDTVKAQEALDIDNSPPTLKGKYSYGLYEQYHHLKEEFLQLCPV